MSTKFQDKIDPQLTRPSATPSLNVLIRQSLVRATIVDKRGTFLYLISGVPRLTIVSHSKADCTNEAVAREFSGTCRHCNEQGHRAADCPTRPPLQCNNCKEEGHVAFQCKNPRKLDRLDVEDIPAEQAWDDLKKGAEEGARERNLDDVKLAAAKYFKSCPDVTYVQLEQAFRKQNIGVYLIALEKELEAAYTNVDLQGNLDKKYSVTWRFSPNPARPKEKDAFPATPEENMERLEDAGEPMDRGLPKCTNCDALGHTKIKCPEELQEKGDRTVVKCFNCDEVGHRVRDCRFSMIPPVSLPQRSQFHRSSDAS